MQELRFVAVSEDGSYAVLAVPGRSGRYILPIDERLRAVAQGQTSRLAQYEIEVESPLRPKEIQARIRAGETAEEIADAAGIPVERVRWFEGPVLAERAYIADQAQAGSVRRAGDSAGPGPRLGDIVTARLSASGTDPADGQWDSRKRGDGNWQVSLTFPSGGRLHVAEWVFDPRRRHVMPDDDNAARLSLPESELPPEPVSLPGEATVTPIASRLGAAAGMGGGSVSIAGSPGMSRFRPERSVIPDRSLGGDRSLADRPAAPPAPAPAPSPSLPAPDWSGGAERPAASRSERSASYGYAEFPESAPYRAPASEPEPAANRAPATAEPRAYRAPAQEPPAYRPPAEPPAYRDPQPESYRPPAAPQPAGYREPEPAPRRAPAAPEPPAEEFPLLQAAAGPVIDDTEREWATPPRPVVFEDPGPALGGEQLEVTPPGTPAEPAPDPAAPGTAAAAGAAVPAAPAAPVAPAAPAASAPAAPVPASPASPAAPAPAPPGASRTEVAAAAARPEAPLAAKTPADSAAAPAEQARHAGNGEHTQKTEATSAAQRTAGTPQTVADKSAAPAPAADATGAAQAATTEATPAKTTGRDSTSAPETTTAVSATPETPAADAAQAATPTAQATPRAPGATPAPATPTAPAASSAPPTAAEAAQPAAHQAEAAPADAAAAAAAAEPEADVPAPAAAPAAEDPSARQRPGAKKNAKGRRSSVPSWDEIMLGSSRQRD